MMMCGQEIQTLADFQRHFSIDEMVYSYYSGELEIWLRQIGETEKAEQIGCVPKNNALLLIRLYQIFDFPLELTEEEIRQQ